MKRLLPFSVLAAAVLVIGVLAFGVPTTSLWILGLVVLCPLMMMFMMRNMQSGGGNGSGGNTQGSGAVPEERGSRSWLGR